MFMMLFGMKYISRMFMTQLGGCHKSYSEENINHFYAFYVSNGSQSVNWLK